MTATVHAGSRHHTASGVVFDLERRLVLLVDHRASGQRQFPGGHIDPDETGAEAMIREVVEETGVHATLWSPYRIDVPGGRWHPAPFLCAEFVAPAKPDKGEPAHRHIDLLYLATADSTAPTTVQVAEVDAAVWLPVDGIHRQAVRADVPVAVEAAWAAMTGRGSR